MCFRLFVKRSVILFLAVLMIVCCMPYNMLITNAGEYNVTSNWTPLPKAQRTDKSLVDKNEEAFGVSDGTQNIFEKLPLYSMAIRFSMLSQDVNGAWVVGGNEQSDRIVFIPYFSTSGEINSSGLSSNEVLVLATNSAGSNMLSMRNWNLGVDVYNKMTYVEAKAFVSAINEDAERYFVSNSTSAGGRHYGMYPDTLNQMINLSVVSRNAAKISDAESEDNPFFIMPRGDIGAYSNMDKEFVNLVLGMYNTKSQTISAGDTIPILVSQTQTAEGNEIVENFKISLSTADVLNADAYDKFSASLLFGDDVKFKSNVEFKLLFGNNIITQDSMLGELVLAEAKDIIKNDPTMKSLSMSANNARTFMADCVAKCEYGKAIVYAIYAYLVEKGLKIEEEQNTQVAGNTGSLSLSEASAQAEAEGTSVQQWFYLINYFFSTGELEDSRLVNNNNEPLKLGNYGFAWVEDKGQDYVERDGEQGGVYNSTFKQVNMEEDLRIRIYYSIMRNYLSITDDAVADKVKNLCESGANSQNVGLDQIFNLKYAIADKDYDADNPMMAMTPESFSIRNQDSVTMPSTAQSEASSASDKFAVNESSPSLKTTVNNFENVMKYFFYGAVTPNAEYSESGGGTSNLVKLNPNIASIIPEFNMEVGNTVVAGEEQKISGEAISFSSLGLAPFPQAKSIGNSYQSIQKYGQMQLALMYVKRWAAVNSEVADIERDDPNNPGTKVTAPELVYNVGAESTYSGLKMKEADMVTVRDAKKENFTNEKLDEWLLKIANETEEAKRKPEADIASIIQYYIQIYKGFEYIGCKSGSIMYDRWIGPEIQRILDYYDSIKEFENVVSAQVNEMQDGDEASFAIIFNDEDKSFMAHYAEGVAASATYAPLVTNLYDPEAWSVIPEESFIDEFHYKYGFLRKALYRDVTANAAMNYYVTGNIGKLKPVTLRDFIENDGSDLVLYIDPKMYRIDKVAEKYNLAYSRLQNTSTSENNDDGLLDSMAHAIATWMETDAESICKTGTAKVYSQEMAAGTDAKGKRSSGWKWDDKNHYIMNDEDIERYLYKEGSDEDEVQKAFAVVSGIYRDKSVFTIAQNESANPKPVFISSKSLCNVTNATKEEFNTIYNYMMVVNLKNKQGMDYNIDNDMDSPLFMDVYGNICTMSGIVVIPSVSNATLYNSTNYDAANSGVASLYNDLESEKIKVSWLRNEEYLDKSFCKDKENKYYIMQNKIYDNGSDGKITLVFANLALSSTNVKKQMYEVAYANAMSTGNGSSGIAGSKFNRRVNLILEVLRGADIEDINLYKEGIAGNTNIDKTGIYIAYRVEQLGSLIMSNSNGNNLLELPNLAFMPGFEYLVVVLFKILFAVMIVLLMIQIYIDGVSDKLGIGTIFSFIFTIASVVISVISLPTLINYSYYHTNKLLLQKESMYMQMLNLEKRLNGQEISIRESSGGASQTMTKFYLKLEQIRVPWWSVITDVMSSNTFSKMQDIYDEVMNSSVYSTFGDGDEDAIIKRGNSMYVDVDWLFDTSRIEFASYSEKGTSSTFVEDKTAGYLYQNVPSAPKMSYLLPYYVILDNLLSNVSEYNQINNVVGYTTTPSGNETEQILTRGLLKPYFTSFEFMEVNSDLLGLYRPYGQNPPKDTGTMFTDEEIETMRRSLWCNYQGLTTKQLKNNLSELDLEARKFIVDNRGMLDKVSDATFIKCMALYLATKHNSIMKVPACRGLEIYAMDTRDIMRLSLTNKSSVMKGSQKSFEKFCFDEGGTFSIILAGFLEVVYWITSLVKPVVIIVLIFALIVSYLYKKLLRLQGNHSLEGYLVSVSLICIVNIVYALCIKLSVLLPKYTSNIIMCLLGQIVLQIGYSLLLMSVAITIIRNLQDIGYYSYKSFYNTHMANRVQAVQVTADRIVSRSMLAPLSRRNRRSAYNYTNYTRTRNITGRDMLNDIQEREERRREDVYNNRR